MGVLGTGIDLSSIDRFRAARNPERLASFFLSPNEWSRIQKSPDIARSLASRFACKEAVLKAVPEDISFLDFEILKNGKKPVVRWNSARPYHVHVSMSHEEAYACAIAVCVDRSL